MRLGFGELLLIAVVIGVIWVGWSFLFAWRKTLRLTKAFHGTSPEMVWLLLVPLFSLIWNFYLLNVTKKGVKAKFKELGKNPGDAGFGIGLAYSILIAMAYVISVIAQASVDATAIYGFLFLASYVAAIIFWRRLVTLNRIMEAPSNVQLSGVRSWPRS